LTAASDTKLADQDRELRISGAAGFRNCGTKATKNAMDFGFSAVTTAACPKVLRAVTRSVSGRVGLGLARRQEQRDAQIDEVDRPDPLQPGEGRGRSQDQRAQPQKRRGHRDQVPHRHTRRRRHRHAPPLADRVGQDQQDRGPRDQQQQQSRPP
jgi:hypothetical protein